MHFVDLPYDFDALVTTMGSITELRGIGISAVYVNDTLMQWMRSQSQPQHADYQRKSYDDAKFVFGKTKSGNERVTMMPYGCSRPVPVKVKHGADYTPWKLVVGYKKENY